MEIWFKYTYMNSFDILNKIKWISSWWTYEYIIIIIWIVMIFWLVFFVIPYIRIYLKSREIEKEKKRKRDLMNRIVLQKSLEDVITRELKEKSNLAD